MKKIYTEKIHQSTRFGLIDEDGRKTSALIQCIEDAKKATEAQTGGFTCKEGCCGVKDNK